MRLKSMTATFGKLEHQTLELQPGLNIIEAPNEWGKSTWCDFLLAMLYGIDTRERTTKTSLAQKERYDPWSGSVMSGSVRLLWQGRDITLERRTKGRIPLGEFRAFETESGLEIPELTADNCGQTLLGVEKSVFTRSGFIKFTDLPVSTDPALSRRLNALVTTGDDSGTAEVMSGKLRDLKNRIRANKSKGLIPQALAQKEALESKCRELAQLELAIGQGRARLESLSAHQKTLLHHQQVLAWEAAKENTARVAQADAAAAQAEAEVQQLEARCVQLPAREDARRQLQGLKQLQEASFALQLEQQMRPPAPEFPPETGVFAGLSREQADRMVASDTAACHKLSKSGTWMVVMGAAISLAGLALGLLLHAAGYALAAAGLVCILIALLLKGNRKKALAGLAEKYGSANPRDWQPLADAHLARRQESESALTQWKAVENDLLQRQKALAQKLPPEGLQNAMDRWQDVLSLHGALEEAQYRAKQAKHHAASLSAMHTAVEQPEGSDPLTCSEAETARLLSDCRSQTDQLHRQLGIYQGRMDALGQAAPLEEELQQVNSRLAQLEASYAAIELAQQTLEAAHRQLQSRFAPRITGLAREMMTKLTAGRYDRLSLTAELSVNAGAEGEDVQREGCRRSDGTLDQLYLSLRLAVARELTPNAPLILDDALIRFDDVRLKAALELLQEEAATRQILLFTCQSREKKALPGL